MDSAVIKLSLRDKPAVDVPDEEHFFRIVQASFAQRRKTLANNLTALVGKDRREALTELLQRLDIDPVRRGETLSLEEFARISRGFLEEGWAI
ncbi:Ribosomal RNA small subunit methyltransferase A [compost metagenome]